MNINTHQVPVKEHLPYTAYPYLPHSPLSFSQFFPLHSVYYPYRLQSLPRSNSLNQLVPRHDEWESFAKYRDLVESSVVHSSSFYL